MAPTQISGGWRSYDNKIEYRFSPPLTSKMLDLIMQAASPIFVLRLDGNSIGILIPSASIFPFSTCYQSVYRDTTICEVDVYLPPDTNIVNKQVVLTIVQDIVTNEGFLAKQELQLDPPISHFHNPSLDAVSVNSAKGMEYTVLGSALIGVSTGSFNILRLVKLMSFVEVLLYFDVDYPSCTEAMFSRFRDSSRISFLSSLTLGAASRDNVCRLPEVFLTRGHSSCSIVSRQFMFYFTIALLLAVKAVAWLVSLKVPSRYARIQKISKLVFNKLDLEHFYNYFDSYFFPVSLESIISILGDKTVYISLNNDLFISDKVFAAVTLSLGSACIVLGTLFVYRTNRAQKRSIESLPALPDTQNTSKVQALLDRFNFMAKRVEPRDRFHGEYILPATQLKSLLAAVILVTLQSSSFATIILVTILQAGLVYLSLYRPNFTLFREYFTTLSMHSGLFICSVLAFPLALITPPTSPSTTYYSIGVPIVTIIVIVFIINLGNMIYGAAEKIIKIIRNRSSKIEAASSEKNSMVISGELLTPTKLPKILVTGGAKGEEPSSPSRQRMRAMHSPSSKLTVSTPGRVKARKIISRISVAPNNSISPFSPELQSSNQQ